MGLKPLHELAEPDPVWDSYRLLGAMTLLDMEHRSAASELQIDAYVAERYTAIRRGQANVDLDAGRIPCGYTLELDKGVNGAAAHPFVSSHTEGREVHDRRMDIYSIFGCIASLLAQSQYHRQFGIGFYMNLEVVEPVRRRQFRIYTERGRPIGFVSWAFLDQATLDDICNGNRSVFGAEWSCGEILFFNDWISPDRLRTVLKDIKTNVFKSTKFATSVRRHKDRRLRKVNAWHQASSILTPGPRAGQASRK